MADDTNFRSYRPVDQRWPAQPASPSGGRESGNDPLAELARLIGQTDPFAELNKTAPPRGSAAAPTRPAPARSSAHQPVPTTPQYPSDPYGSPLEFGGKGFDTRGYTEPQQENFQPAYDPAIFGTPQQDAASGFPSDGYYDDPSRLPHGGDEAYEDDYPDERPRRGMKLILATVALVVIGGSGVVAYRALFSGGVSGPPPVIKANTAPSKVAPAPSAEGSNKQIQDRVGDASQGERVVPREETPVEVKDTSRPVPARVVFPGMPATTASTPDNAMATASPPLPTDPGGPSAAEPKKIRTVAIRPDQVNGGTGSTARSNAASVPAQRTAAPAPAAPALTPMAAPPAQQGNSPLSLNPQVAEASARSPFPPAPRATAPAPAAPTRLAAVPPATQVGSGAYTVQISSQRSENEAQATFRSLQTKFPSLLGDRQPIIQRADLGEKGIYFRTMVGGFASIDQAVQFCGSLKSAGGQCVVPRN
jgi:hypothetical protein